MKGIGERADAEMQHLTYVAWQVANLSRAKTIPKLNKLLSDLKRAQAKSGRQTAAQQIAIAHRWAALGVGRIGKLKPRGSI